MNCFQFAFQSTNCFPKYKCMCFGKLPKSSYTSRKARYLSGKYQFGQNEIQISVIDREGCIYGLNDGIGPHRYRNIRDRGLRILRFWEKKIRIWDRGIFVFFCLCIVRNSSRSFSLAPSALAATSEVLQWETRAKNARSWAYKIKSRYFPIVCDVDARFRTANPTRRKLILVNGHLRWCAVALRIQISTSWHKINGESKISFGSVSTKTCGFKFAKFHFGVLVEYSQAKKGRGIMQRFLDFKVQLKHTRLFSTFLYLFVRFPLLWSLNWLVDSSELWTMLERLYVHGFGVCVTSTLLQLCCRLVRVQAKDTGTMVNSRMRDDLLKVIFST